MAEVKIKKKLYDDICQYCELNNIEDIEKEINKILQGGFNVLRFGLSPLEKKEMEKEKEPKKTRTRKVTPKAEVQKEVKEEEPKQIETTTEPQPIEQKVEESSKPIRKKIRILKHE